jgi:hypothetical protein
MSEIPPFRDGLRVMPSAGLWRVDVLHPTAKTGTLWAGVGLIAEALDLPDDRVLNPALKVLNDHIADWPVGPFTAAQVRERAAGWA